MPQATASRIDGGARTGDAAAWRNRWTIGAATLSRAIALGKHDHPLQLIVRQLVEIADASLVSVVQPGPSADSVVVTAAAGAGARSWDGYILPSATSIAAQVMADGEALIMPCVAESSLPGEIQDLIEADAAMFVPLTGSATTSTAVLIIARRSDQGAFTDADLGMATMFAGQIALALELAEVQERREHMTLVEERDRIARDLHDHVIQRLFAIGLTMQSASMHATGRPAQQLRSSVDDIDETIKQIRSTIYRLTTPIVSRQTSLRARTERLLDDLELALGFRPLLSVDGPVDFGVDEDVIDDCLAVLREALTNVARHAGASRAAVAVRVGPSTLTLDVRDNGRGLGPVSRRSGLSNMRVRAERRDGSFVVHSDGASGTRLIWTVPNPPVTSRVSPAAE